MFVLDDVRGSGSYFILKVISSEPGDTEQFAVAKELFKLPETKELDEMEYLHLKEAAAKTAAVKKALDIISRSPNSRSNLEKRLRFEHGMEREDAAFAADYVTKRGYLDEVSQAEREAWLSLCKGRGKTRVVADLRKKGYSGDVARSAADSIDDGEYFAALKKMIEKRVARKPLPPEKKKKLTAALMRAGHRLPDIKKAYCLLLSEGGGEFSEGETEDEY